MCIKVYKLPKETIEAVKRMKPVYREARAESNNKQEAMMLVMTKILSKVMEGELFEQDMDIVLELPQALQNTITYNVR